MIRKVALLALGMVLTAAGLIGLVLPVIPGLLLLAAAAGCFSLASARFHSALDGRLRCHPRLRLLRQRWHSGRDLRPLRRTALAFWLALASLLPERR